jgi:hypothetical protein
MQSQDGLRMQRPRELMPCLCSTTASSGGCARSKERRTEKADCASSVLMSRRPDRRVRRRLCALACMMPRTPSNSCASGPASGACASCSRSLLVRARRGSRQCTMGENAVCVMLTLLAF